VFFQNVFLSIPELIEYLIQDTESMWRQKIAFGKNAWVLLLKKNVQFQLFFKIQYLFDFLIRQPQYIDYPPNKKTAHYYRHGALVKNFALWSKIDTCCSSIISIYPQKSRILTLKMV